MSYSRPQLKLLVLLAAILLAGLGVREWRAGFPDAAERLDRFDREDRRRRFPPRRGRARFLAGHLPAWRWPRQLGLRRGRERARRSLRRPCPRIRVPSTSTVPTWTRSRGSPAWGRASPGASWTSVSASAASTHRIACAASSAWGRRSSRRCAST